MFDVYGNWGVKGLARATIREVEKLRWKIFYAQANYWGKNTSAGARFCWAFSCSDAEGSELRPLSSGLIEFMHLGESRRCLYPYFPVCQLKPNPRLLARLGGWVWRRREASAGDHFSLFPYLFRPLYTFSIWELVRRANCSNFFSWRTFFSNTLMRAVSSIKPIKIIVQNSFTIFFFFSFQQFFTRLDSSCSSHVIQNSFYFSSCPLQ